MNLKMKSLVLVVTLSATVALAHSCFKQKLDTKDELPKIDRAQLCQDGGASIDAATNECICSGGTTWNGVRCDVVAKDDASNLTEPEGIDTPVAEIEQPKAVEVVSTTIPSPEPVKPAEAEPVKAEESSPDFLALVHRACRIGNGVWLKKFEYCHCPDGKVLMGRRCRPMNGRMIDDVCLRAVNKGTWKDGICTCAEGEVFSAGRGGCVKSAMTDKTILRRICENSMNNGRWNDVVGECSCPVGKMMIGETCENKSKMTSAEVCESPGISGKWDATEKTCDCPEKKIWANQTCFSPAEIDAESACIASTNRGKWVKSKGLCACPKGERWIPSKKICIK
jgi:hypothetical protein